MRTLITGATGFIGRRLVRPDDRALVRRPAGFADEVIGDLLEPGSLAAACDGVETVFHCAGLADALGDPEALWRINVEGTRNLLAAAGRAGVKRFVFLSSVKAMAEPGGGPTPKTSLRSVLPSRGEETLGATRRVSSECVDEDWPGEPATPYGRAKRTAEAAVLEAGAKYGMHVVNLRLAMVYGRGSRGNLWRLARAVKRGWFPALPETGQRRSLIHVQDVVEAARLVADRPQAAGRTYILAHPKAHSTHEIEATIREILDAPARWCLPAWSLQMAGRLHARLRDIVDRLLGPACYSPARIERDLGWRARVSLREGLQDMLEERS